MNDASTPPDSRRSFLKQAAGAALGAALLSETSCSGPHGAPEAGGIQAASSIPRGFRFVHLTDIHVQPELRAFEGMAAALKEVEALRPRPDFILTGGDLVFDAMEVDAARSRMLFELYRKVAADHTSIPIRNTIGNHDIFGWMTPGVTAGTAGYGRAMVKEQLSLDQTYYTFDHKGWRFYVLDNIQPRPGRDPAYTGFLGGEQSDWLRQELARKPAGMPAVMCEHIPFLTVTLFRNKGFQSDASEWRIANGVICGDAPARLEMMRDRNVKLSLSGHIHQLDHIEYCGTHFICDGAVCGAWWKGPHHAVPEGFGVIDLGADGSVRHEYHAYGWRAT